MLCISGVEGSESCYKVTYDVRNICAPEGSSVDISCSHSRFYRIRSKLWFSGGQQWTSSSAAGSQGRVQVLDTEQGKSTLRMTDLRKSDSAEYHFKFQTASFTWDSVLPGITLTVTGTNKIINPSLLIFNLTCNDDFLI